MDGPLGAYRLGSAYFTRTRQLLDSPQLLPFDRLACHEAARLGSELAARGLPIASAELLVAPVTKRHGERLVTRDRSFVHVY